MYLRRIGLILAGAFAAIAQQTGSVEGRVTRSAADPGDLQAERPHALALDRIDSTNLENLAILRRATLGTRVRIEAERVAYIELKPSH